MKFSTTIVVLSSLLCWAWLVGCTDVSSTGPTPPTFNSEYRFLNAAEDLGSVSISLDLGPDVGSIDYRGASSHETYPSGNRVAALSNDDTLRIAMTSEQRATVLILPMTGTTREFLKMVERPTYDSATTSTGLLRIVNASVDVDTTDGATIGGPSVDITVTGQDTVTVDGLAYRGDSGYLSVSAGSYTLSVIATGDTTETVIATGNMEVSNSRSSAVLTGSVPDSTLAFVGLSDD